MLNRNRRAAKVRTGSEGICYELKFEDIPEAIKIKMLADLAVVLAAKLEQEAEEITELSHVYCR